MAYDPQKLEQEAVKAIKENNLFFVTDVPAFLPCNTATFYNHELEKLETIKEALNENRTKTKNLLRDKWLASDNATLQVALMKLISEDDERKKLSQSYIEMDANVKTKIDFDAEPDAIKTLIKTYQSIKNE